jgi:hypothetical protein
MYWSRRKTGVPFLVMDEKNLKVFVDVRELFSNIHRILLSLFVKLSAELRNETHENTNQQQS